jgi:hypothetical protein
VLSMLHDEDHRGGFQIPCALRRGREGQGGRYGHIRVLLADNRLWVVQDVI